MLLGAGRQGIERNPHLLLQEKGLASVPCTDISLNLPEYLESRGTAVVSWLLLALSRLMQLNWGHLQAEMKTCLAIISVSFVLTLRSYCYFLVFPDIY